MKNLAKLYKLTLKKLLIPELIIGIMSIVSSVLYLGGEIKTQSNYDYGVGNFFRGQPTAAVIAPALIIVMFLGSAVLTFIAFNYLNKRNASDFYHALPYTRMETFWSGILAVLTYQLTTIVLTLVASYVLLSVTAVSFNAAFFPLLLLGYTACSLVVIGAVALAMSITGTVFSNVMVSGLILFLPRMLLFVMDSYITNVAMRRVLVGQMGILLNPVYNIATASLLDISRLWQYYGLSETLINPGSIIYTAVLGLIYVVLAGVLMKRRPSELAGNGAPSSKIASVYNALICLPILIFGIYSINGQPLSTIDYRTLMTLIIIVAVALAIFIVIGFALNTKWKDVFKSLPWFAIAFAAAVVIVFGASLTAREMATKLPARDQIAYVRIDENMETEYRFRPTYDYNSLLVSQLQFDDENVVDLFYNTLKQNNEQWEIQSSGDYSNTYSSSGRLICEFKLKSGKSIYRRLILYTKDIDDIYDALTENDAYLQAHTDLPENGTVFTYENGIEQAEIEAVWEVFKTEYAAMPTSKQLYLNTVYRYSPIYSVKIQNIARTQYISNFQVTGYIGDTPYTKTVEISEFIPKTADYYMKLVNSKSKMKLAADLSNESIQMNKGEVLNVNIMVPVEGGDTLNFFYSSDFDEEEMKYMLEALTAQEFMDIARMLKRQDLDNVSIDAPFATVYVSRYGTYEDENDYYTCYVPLSEDDLNLLIELHSQKAMSMEAAG